MRPTLSSAWHRSTFKMALSTERRRKRVQSSARNAGEWIAKDTTDACIVAKFTLLGHLNNWMRNRVAEGTKSPGSHTICHADRQQFYWSLSREFPYGIFYTAEKGTVTVYAVIDLRWSPSRLEPLIALVVWSEDRGEFSKLLEAERAPLQNSSIFRSCSLRLEA